MKLLMVEDEAPLREALSRVFKRHGHDVVATPDAESAIALMTQGMVPDVVLLDINLGPGMDGWAVAGFLRTSERFKRVQVVIVSGLSVKEIRDGAHTYISALTNAAIICSKPVDTEYILKLLERAKP